VLNYDYCDGSVNTVKGNRWGDINSNDYFLFQKVQAGDTLKTLFQIVSREAFVAAAPW
jgi:hypothetical protein